jgi:flavin reductase (DIM6/NTAB) family NADH-FMN oxidoreductase RutF
MLHYEPKDLSVPEVHRLLLGGVAPRPIALVSTLSEDGINNLSPFSFFNAFGANPPVVAFSPARRGRDGTLKDTYNNLIKTNECVIQSVTYDMVEQINLASAEYTPEVDEFVKSGLTPIDSDIVKPKRVKESPFQMECRLLEMKSYGDKGSSANMAICEVIKFHIDEDIFSEGIIHPDLIDLVARMSADFYTRASGESIFTIQKPLLKKCIGYDGLPLHIRESEIYSANNLAKLANGESVPSEKEIKEFIVQIEADVIPGFASTEQAFYRYRRKRDHRKMFKAALILAKENKSKKKLFIELSAKTALENNDSDFAWKTAMVVGMDEWIGG